MDRALERIECNKAQQLEPVWSPSYSHDHLGLPFRTFRGPLYPKPVTGQELFFAVSYSKPALVHPTLHPTFFVINRAAKDCKIMIFKVIFIVKNQFNIPENGFL